MKWNKKICVEYIQGMKSPIEEMVGTANNQNPLQGAADRLRQLIADEKQTSPSVEKGEPVSKARKF